MIANRNSKPSYQSDFFRNSYYKMLRLLLGIVFLNLVLIAIIIYQIIFIGKPTYYASTTAGQIISLKSIQR